MMIYDRIIIRFLLLFLPCIDGAARLNEYILHYEPLRYDAQILHQKHLRAKRSVHTDPSVHLSFQAHGKNFNLRLKRDTSVFSNNVVVEGPGGAVDVDTSHIYSGHLRGEPNTHVYGAIRDGVFDGKIITPQGTYYVERASKFFPPHENQSLHSVIYAESDVIDPYEKQRAGHEGGCGVTDETLQWMERIQNSAKEDEAEEIQAEEEEDAFSTPPQMSPSASIFEENHAYLKYTREANSESREFDEPGSREKRAISWREESSKGTCSLFIQTDPLLWRHIYSQEKNDVKTREEILSLIAQHVKAVNYIYSSTKFVGKYNPQRYYIRFEVQRIKIDDDRACHPDWRGDKNIFCIENIDVSNFLNLHSLVNHQHFCLAYVFTYRDFTGGTLGLAWVASASGASGGICEKYKTYTETVGGVYQSTQRSLNTGIITFVNYNSRVPPKVSQLTLAHEIGHNFGSPHDYPQECRPGGPQGNFIMFASATSGDRPNNSKFSQCSVRNISAVLDAIREHKKNNCFTASNGSFCGNKIVEEGEECDCGYDNEECSEHCCYPRIVSEFDKFQNSSAEACRRKPNTECSPSQGPCCEQGCRFVSSGTQKVCKLDSNCSYQSTCNGSSALCPDPMPKDNLTECNEGTQVCIKGECLGSVCLKLGLQECFLTSDMPNIDKRKLCELACQNGTDANTCKSTSEWAPMLNLKEGISLRPGSPCDNYQGYCDVFLKCRAVDAEGPLARLKNLIFNRETLLTIAQWITEKWWAVLLMGVAFIIFMGLFIKCCAVHTPSSNPKKPPHLRLSETLRRPMNTLRRKVSRYHQGNSGAPPPYPGCAGPSRAPARGYGEGRGQYNRTRASAPPAGAAACGSQYDPYAGAYQGRTAIEMRSQNKV